MTLDPSVWVFAFAWFMAGLINGLSGMGAAMLALPIAATAMPPKLLIPATCLMVLVVSVSTAVFYLKNIRRRAFLALLLGAIPGSLAGLGILLFTPVPSCRSVPEPLWFSTPSGSSAIRPSPRTGIPGSPEALPDSLQGS